MTTFSESTPVTFSGSLPEAVDVVVIGAGIIGTATAWFLARKGMKVALCEKGRVSGEQSSRNWGWVRQQGRDAAELPIMMESSRIWRGLAAETGEKDLTFTAAGCVYLADSESQLAQVRILARPREAVPTRHPHALGTGGAGSSPRCDGTVGGEG